MRTSPLLADFIQARGCKPICEKYLTLPSKSVSHSSSTSCIRKGTRVCTIVHPESMKKLGRSQNEISRVCHALMKEMRALDGPPHGGAARLRRTAFCRRQNLGAGAIHLSQA